MTDIHAAIDGARFEAGFNRFRVLWAQYEAALRVPFSLDREQDHQIKTEVERCYDQLARLAKEGV